MTIPFLHLFKKNAATKRPVVEKALPAPIEKPSGERLSKTVMPNAARTVAPQDPFRIAAGSGGPAPASPAAAPRTISFGGGTPSPTPAQNLPAAVALALEPRVERVIALELGDVIAQMPVGYIKPTEELDVTRRVLLNASEVERGMANGRPSVSVASIYQQAPELFVRAVAQSDAAQVQLPFAKVLEQITHLRVRLDQLREQAVPQVATPFLQVTLEDNSRFGTTTGPLQTGDLPPVRLEPATAQTLAAAEPEPAASEKFRPAANGHVPAIAKENAVHPARIPFKITPKGTDVPAPERVPASSGPSVPTSLPMPAPTRIAFKITPPCADLRPKPEPWLIAESPGLAPKVPATAEPAVSAEAAAIMAPDPAPAVETKSEVKIVLALKPLLQGLPAFQLSGDPASVPEDARIELPFSLVEPQLAAGRVSVAPEIFSAAMAEEFRSLFSGKESAAPVALPLQEVLKNLPGSSLRMRDDQVEQEAGQNFATPFSAKAEEDAKRFNVEGTPVAKPGVAPAAPGLETAPAEEVFEASKPAGKPGRTALQAALDTDEELDAKAVVACVGKMAGVQACAIMFSDGLSLAGNLPEEFHADGLCAMAPALLQRIENHMVETKLGALRAMTLSCARAAVTFFMHDNLCLAALHAKGELASEVRERLARAVHELSRKYSHPI